MGIAAHQRTPGLPAPISAAAHSLCFVHVKHGLGRRGSWEGAGWCWRGASLLPGGMLKQLLCFLSEIEAKKACDWLRAAGFPQYAQLYEGESCLLLLIPVPALHRVSYPLSQSHTEGGCRELCGEERTERIVY